MNAINSAPDLWCVAAAASNVVTVSVRTGQEGNNIALSASDGNASVPFIRAL